METMQRNFEGLNPNDLRRLMDDALQRGTIKDLELLFNDGMDVNQEDFEGRTALMLSAAKGKVDAVKMLLKRNADINRVFMYQGRIPLTALDAALQEGKEEIISILLEHGAKTGKELNSDQY